MKDHDYIKERFDSDGLKAPDKLSAEELRKQLPEDMPATVVGPRPEDPRQGFSNRRRLLRPAIGFAACACIVLAFVPITKAILGQSPNFDGLSKDKNGLYKFSSYKELHRTVDQILKGDNDMVYITGGDVIVEDSEELYSSESSDMPATDGAQGEAAATPKSDSQGHSSTYAQVEGVDEADVVKTDGKYIYYVSRAENQVIIASAKDGKTKRLSSVGEEGDSIIRDIYIDGDKLILLSDTRSKLPEVSGKSKKSSEDEATYPLDDSVNATAMTVYDLGDRSKPVLSGRYLQGGSLLSSRMTGGQVLLVTDQPVRNYGDEPLPPVVCYGNEDAKALDIENVSCVPSPRAASYTLIGLMDPSEGKLSEKRSNVRAVLGGSEKIYCNREELYVTAEVMPERKQGLFGLFGEDSLPDYENTQTHILKVDFSKGKLDMDALGLVKGSVNDQFSMDARDGYFRIATTSRRNGEDVNDLFILDKGLKEVGSVRNFARDEHIEAVRYIGKFAYVITYEQTDPLFIIDLSDPKDPAIKGHVKISGFSTLLAPVDADHMLGFGFSTESTEGGEVTDGLKLALFDISDPSEPKVADSMSFTDVSSDIQYDHRALLAGPDNSYFAIPFDRYQQEWIEDVEIDGDVIVEDAEGGEEFVTGSEVPDSGIMVFDAREGKLKLTKQFDSEESVRRCIYIGDWIYGIHTDDSIGAYKL